jgi:hypothetical protein
MDRRTKREIAAIKVGTIIVCKVNHRISHNSIMGSAMIVSEGTEYTVRKVLDKHGSVEVMGDKNGSYSGHLDSVSTRSPAILRWGEYERLTAPKSCKSLLDEIESDIKDSLVLIQSVREIYVS